MQILAAFVFGLIFGVGILISGMGNPAKVLNFFDVAGTWDPSLAFVMGGALAVTAVGYRLVLARSAPLLSQNFNLPPATTIDGSLLAGSALFGIGWGLAGYCPGGVIPMLATGHWEVALFIASLTAGLIAAKSVRILTAERGPPGSRSDRNAAFEGERL